MDFCSIHLPDLCVASIFGCLQSAEDLQAAALVCHAGLTQAQAAAQTAVTRLRIKLEADGPTATVDCRADGAATPWIAELRSWEATDAAHHVWLDASFCETASEEDVNDRSSVSEQVEKVTDRSGNGLHAEATDTDTSVGPSLVRRGPNGQPVFAFSYELGGVPCLLQTRRFAAPLTGPITCAPHSTQCHSSPWRAEPSLWHLAPILAPAPTSPPPLTTGGPVQVRGGRACRGRRDVARLAQRRLAPLGALPRLCASPPRPPPDLRPGGLRVLLSSG